MNETLLSTSNVLLFGRIVDDLKIVEPEKIEGVPMVAAVASTGPVDIKNWPLTIDGIPLNASVRQVLIKDQEEANANQNGIYRRTPSGYKKQNLDIDEIYLVTIRFGTSAGKQYLIENGEIKKFTGKSKDPKHSPFVVNREGLSSQLEQQLSKENHPSFARIYGFSFEGTYHELGRPALFLVHGDGVPASEIRGGPFARPLPSRAPGSPSLTGLAAADFQFADDVLVWSYDKADYTIRMDVESGMLEDILLAAFFGDGGGVSGARVSGARVSGARVSGARVSGARVSGARLSGGRGDASD